MNSRRLRIVATIIASLILLSFFLSVPRTKEVVEKTVQASEEPSIPLVTIRDAYRKGVHTITGSIEAPTPCVSLSAEATTVGTESSTEGILVSVSMPEDTGVCLQRITKLTFSATVSAPEGIPITVTVNGVTASTTVP